MELSNLQPTTGSRHSNNFRKGRGYGSGNDKAVGKGHRGQETHPGTTRSSFEDGQTPLYRRLPECGLINMNSKATAGTNVSTLERFGNDTEVTVETLVKAGIARSPRDGVKVLGNGELTKRLTAKVNTFSEDTKSKIEVLGGTCEVI